MTGPMLNATDADLLRKEWGNLQAALPDASRLVLAGLVQRHAPALVALFYRELEGDSDARDYFSQDVISSRLNSALQRWLVDLLPASGPADFDAMAAQQLSVGAIHARIGLPLKLVNRGLRLLNDGLMSAILAEEGPSTRGPMMSVACQTLSIAIDIMNTAYAEQSRRHSQSTEAFRLFALGKNLSQEREAQRAAMAEWLQEVMFIIATRDGLEKIPDLQGSEFGLWLTHRGGVLFEGTLEMQKAAAIVRQIDLQLLPQIRAGADVALPLAQLNRDAAEIRALVLQCFTAAARIEGGHDALTGVLSRRFMDAILTREVETARKRRQSFSVALIDLDFFKSVNDRYGHSAGDLVLKHCAGVISETARVGDFVFRYGGEEFLVTLAEASLQQASDFGARVLAALSARDVILPDGTAVALTASIGVAEFRGEPDFHRLTHAADTALYAAKRKGRNQVCAAG